MGVYERLGAYVIGVNVSCPGTLMQIHFVFNSRIAQNIAKFNRSQPYYDKPSQPRVSGYHRPASETPSSLMAFRCRADSGPLLDVYCEAIFAENVLNFRLIAYFIVFISYSDIPWHLKM